MVLLRDIRGLRLRVLWKSDCSLDGEVPVVSGCWFYGRVSEKTSIRVDSALERFVLNSPLLPLPVTVTLRCLDFVSSDCWFLGEIHKKPASRRPNAPHSQPTRQNWIWVSKRNQYHPARRPGDAVLSVVFDCWLHGEVCFFLGIQRQHMVHDKFEHLLGTVIGLSSRIDDFDL